MPGFSFERRATGMPCRLGGTIWGRGWRRRRTRMTGWRGSQRCGSRRDSPTAVTGFRPCQFLPCGFFGSCATGNAQSSVRTRSHFSPTPCQVFMPRHEPLTNSVSASARGWNWLRNGGQGIRSVRRSQCLTWNAPVVNLQEASNVSFYEATRCQAPYTISSLHTGSRRSGLLMCEGARGGGAAKFVPLVDRIS